MKNKNYTYLFVTGMMRSGTTMVQQIISSDPNSHILYQPNTEFLVDTKKQFLNERAVDGQLPLSHYFCEEEYSFNDFLSFLNRPYRYNFTENEIDFKVRKEKDFIEIFTKHHDNLCSDINYNIIGSKEILCEEYIPYLADNGFKTILVIRDLRDVITSMNYGNGAQYTGKKRPTLFNIRNWRKSVAFYLKMLSHPNFHMVKYENLVGNFDLEIDKIIKFLDDKISVQDINLSGLKNNSSYEGEQKIYNSSIGKYKNILPHNVSSFIGVTCYAELKLLGYKISEKDFSNYEEIIMNFNDDYKITRPEFKGDNYNSKDHKELEVKRIKLMQSGDIMSKELEKMFIFEEAFYGLRDAVN